MPSPIPLRRLGKDGPEVPAMGFGLMGLSIAYGVAPPDSERFGILDRAVEIGATFWDTSDYYGDSHELLGKWFRRTGKRADIFLATKFGFLTEGGDFKVDSSAARARAVCEDALQKMGTDHIDLYYAHSLNPDTPVEETMRALAELKAEGKIRHIGLSNISSATVRRAVKIAPVAAVQVEYSPFQRDIEGPNGGPDLLATCRELGIALVSYSPLGRGILTGAVPTVAEPTDLRNVLDWFKPENHDANKTVAEGFAALARRRGCSPAQLALAWLLRQGPDVIPIPGTKKIKYLLDNWAALDLELSAEDEREIRAFTEATPVAGLSIPVGLAHLTFVDTREETAA